MTPVMLHEPDRARILDYIGSEPEMNLFIFGDMENHGVDNEPARMCAFEDGRGGWDCILQQFYDYYIIYTPNARYDVAAVAEYLKDREPDCISGKAELVEALAPYFPQFKVKLDYMTRCRAVTPGTVKSLPDGAVLRALKADEALDACVLLSQIDEFADCYEKPGALKKDAERLRASMEHDGCLLYGIFEDGVLAATAATSAANSQSAMITSVATLPEYRGRGYASAVVEAICRDSFAQGKRFLCLFYDNPAAGRIYERIGFCCVGKYSMLG